MITVDKKMRHQQSLAGRQINVIVLGGERMTLPYIAPLVDKLLGALEDIPPGEFLLIEPD